MANDLDPLRRFSDRVDDYVRHRPTYPPGVIALLRSKTGLSPDSVVADVGAGTGIFTRQLLETGARVLAIEPNDAMRAAAIAALQKHANFTAINGTGEATGLATGSVSLITCAQAFHWFDPLRARAEFSRILRPAGWCALLWNSTHASGSEFAVGYEQIIRGFALPGQRVRHEEFEREGRFDLFFGARRWEKHVFDNEQTLDWDGLKGRLLSSSYAPRPSHPQHEPMITALRALFERTQTAGTVRVTYSTDVFLGQLANRSETAGQ